MENFKNEKDRFVLWKNIINKYSLLNKTKINMIEIGVWKGDFAKYMLDNCQHIDNYYLVDPWRNLDNWNKPFNVDDKKFNTIYNEVCNKLNIHKNKIHILRGKTNEVINKISDNTIDIIYIDGDHTAKGITIDLIMSFPKVKNGGILGGDDYVNNIYQHNANKYDPTMVKPVVDGFIIANGDKISQFFSNHNQFLIKKI